MNSISCLYPINRSRLLDGPLAAHVDPFVAHLRHGRYAWSTVRRYLVGVAHFAQWLTRTRVLVEQLDEAVISRFLHQHLPRCACAAPVERNRRDLHSACSLLLMLLRERGVVAKPSLPRGHINDELRDFDAHLQMARGLGSGTRTDYLRIVRQFLVWRFAERPVAISALKPNDIKTFFAAKLEDCPSSANAASVACALRAYLRYRAGCGDAVLALRGAILSPAHWNLSTLPRSLSAQEIERVLAAFPATLPAYRRGYAIVRCALDLGLRIGEITNLKLDDIDWRNGTVTLRRNKSRREHILPLPAITGRAIADYLRHERPSTTNPAVFVRHLAPRDVPLSVDGLHEVIRSAYQRAGLKHGRSHALRHSLARRMVEHGSSIKEVADVLRHRSLNTTLIYAKLDTPRLAAVALPWPGSVQ
jgi:integrase/recombinase XerC